MTPEQRQQALNSDRLKNQFSPSERNLLTGVSELPLAPSDGAEPSPDDQ